MFSLDNNGNGAKIRIQQAFRDRCSKWRCCCCCCWNLSQRLLSRKGAWRKKLLLEVSRVVVSRADWRFESSCEGTFVLVFLHARICIPRAQKTLSLEALILLRFLREREREPPPLLNSMSNLQTATSSLWREEGTASIAAPGKWIPSCAYNDFRVLKSNNRTKTLFMHTSGFLRLELESSSSMRRFPLQIFVFSVSHDNLFFQQREKLWRRKVFFFFFLFFPSSWCWDQGNRSSACKSLWS